MRAQNDPLVLNRFSDKWHLLAVVVDLNPDVRDKLLRKLRHDIVALAQRLSSDLHANVAL